VLTLTWVRSQQLLCFCNPGTARRRRRFTEKLMGKGEGEGRKGEAAPEN